MNDSINQEPVCRTAPATPGLLNIKGELLNSKTEWHQPKLIRTTINTGGVELAEGKIVSLPPLPQVEGQGPGPRPGMETIT